MNSDSFKNDFKFKLFTYKLYIIYIYKQDLALGDQQGFISHKTQPNQYIYIYNVLLESFAKLQ